MRVLTQVPAMIPKKHDDRVISNPKTIEFIEDPSDLLVHERD